MIKKLDELNKKRKEVLKFIDLKKIDFNSSSRIIPIEAIKCNRKRFVDYRLFMGSNNSSQDKSRFDNNPRMFRGNKINIGLLNFIEELAIDIQYLCIEYYYFIQDNRLRSYKVGKRITPNNPVKWINFFNNLFVLRISRIYGIRKNRVFFLMRIDDVLRKMIKERK